MTGIYEHSLDAKGRLSIPAKLREELGDVFYVTLSTEKCLSAYNLESWNRFMEKIKSMPKLKQTKMRPCFPTRPSVRSTARGEFYCLRTCGLRRADPRCHGGGCGRDRRVLG